MLARADCTRIFSEKISTRVKERRTGRVPSCSPCSPSVQRWSGKASGRRRWNRANRWSPSRITWDR
ncbi:hypothetical protein ACIQZO_12650 [Streptomyces sp. NPDC097617]|uniref:hypothetical protein n=1 Tax=Streptomyces sp. NPDC097617 TaxID=3366091 RepID=UPI0037F1F9EF